VSEIKYSTLVVKAPIKYVATFVFIHVCFERSSIGYLQRPTLHVSLQ